VLHQVLRALIQLDIVGEQPGAFDTHAFEILRQMLAARRELNNLSFEARRGGLLRAGPLVKAGQVGSQHGILFADRMDLRLQSVEFAAGDFNRFFLIETGLFLFRHQRLIALPLGARLFVLTGQALMAIRPPGL